MLFAAIITSYFYIYCLLPIAHWLQPWYSIVKNCPLEGTLGVFLPDQSNSLMTSASAL